MRRVLLYRRQLWPVIRPQTGSVSASVDSLAAAAARLSQRHREGSNVGSDL
jgi:hypothetical protein